MVVMSSTPAISGHPSRVETVTGNRATMMMSYFGHEAIFTLDYAINENQMFDCLMLCQRRSAWVSSAPAPPS